MDVWCLGCPGAFNFGGQQVPRLGTTPMAGSPCNPTMGFHARPPDNCYTDITVEEAGVMVGGGGHLGDFQSPKDGGQCCLAPTMIELSMHQRLELLTTWQHRNSLFMVNLVKLHLSSTLVTSLWCLPVSWFPKNMVSWCSVQQTWGCLFF